MTRRWAVAAACAAGGLALAFWLVHAPAAKVQAQPLHVPKLAGTQPHTRATDAPELEAAQDDAPLMPVGTVDLPEQLDRRQLEAAMNKIKPHLEKCRHVEEFTGTLTVRLTIAKSGNVQSVLLVTPAEKTLTSECVLKTVRSASFPRFRGTLLPTIELTYPFLFRPEGGTL
jgi:outer membrane biosynthesis protein TonB